MAWFACVAIITCLNPEINSDKPDSVIKHMPNVGDSRESGSMDEILDER